MKEVIIWDGVCGMGKTQQTRRHILELTAGLSEFSKSDPKVIYVTPYREEVFVMADVAYTPKTLSNKTAKPKFKGHQVVERTKPDVRHVKFPFLMDSNLFGSAEGAVESLRKLILANKVIATTHASFFKLPEDVLQLLTEHNYHIIIDEVPEVVKIMEPESDITESEFNTLLELGIISKDINNLMSWSLPNSHHLKRYDDLKKILDTDSCFFHGFRLNRTILIAAINPLFFKSGLSVKILTYLFKGSFCRAYFKWQEIPVKIENLTDLQFFRNSNIHDYKYLINIYLPRGKLKRMFTDDNAFNITWYSKQAESLGVEKVKLSKEGSYELSKLKSLKKSPLLHELSKSTNSFFKLGKVYLPKEHEKRIRLEMKTDIHPELREILRKEIEHEKCSLSERLWSTYKPYQKILIPRNSAFTLERFLSFNMRATNSFRDVKMMAYLVNIYPNGDIKSFFAKRGVIINNDAYATGEMLQWIFRSRLRSGSKIIIFLPSIRMRKLLEKWMNEFEEMKLNAMERELPQFSHLWKE